jgi:hypothetical protein
LRNLGQQSRLALGAVMASGRMGELRDLMESAHAGK